MDETLISQVPLFATLPPDEIRYLAEKLRLREIPAGVTLIHEGGRDERFYILLEGQVEVFKTMSGPAMPDDPAMPEESIPLNTEERNLGQLNQGALIGEMSLFSRDSQHTASVRALSPLRLLEMTRGEFDALLQRQPAMTYDLVRLLSRRLERSENVTILDLQEKNLQLTKAYLELKAAQALLVEKEKLEHELELARDIQLGILPEPIPALPGFDFGALMVPARVVGGDFYDFIPLDDERMGIVVGDVSDKSMPAAMYMSLSYSLIRAEARRSDSPAETLQNVNRHLLDISSSDMFVTVLYGILNRATREFRFARAGHEYPIIMDKRGQPLELARTTGRLMGLFDDLKLNEQSFVFPAGGAALIFSDGITEAMDVQGKQFGAGRALDFLSRQLASATPHSTAQRISERLLQDVQDFTRPAPQQDDITIVTISGMG
jgi:serine phosphatase RsbU (regulator of sigma subunit)